MPTVSLSYTPSKEDKNTKEIIAEYILTFIADETIDMKGSTLKVLHFHESLKQTSNWAVCTIVSSDNKVVKNDEKTGNHWNEKDLLAAVQLLIEKGKIKHASREEPFHCSDGDTYLFTVCEKSK